MQNTTQIIVIVLVVLLALSLLGGFGMMGFGMMGPGMMSGYGFSPLRMVLGLTFWALIMGGVTLLVVHLLRNAKSSSPPGELPLDILKARYARGEITKEQFDAIKRDLVA